MKRKSVASLIAIVAIVTAVIFAGCTESYTKIRDILDDPDEYDGKKVTVAGTVAFDPFKGITKSASFKLKSKADEILVVPGDYEGKLPRTGHAIKVIGIVRHGIAPGVLEGMREYEYTKIELESWKYRD